MGRKRGSALAGNSRFRGGMPWLQALIETSSYIEADEGIPSACPISTELYHIDAAGNAVRRASQLAGCLLVFLSDHETQISWNPSDVVSTLKALPASLSMPGG